MTISPVRLDHPDLAGGVDRWPAVPTAGELITSGEGSRS